MKFLFDTLNITIVFVKFTCFTWIQIFKYSLQMRSYSRFDLKFKTLFLNSISCFYLSINFVSHILITWNCLFWQWYNLISFIFYNHFLKCFIQLSLTLTSLNFTHIVLFWKTIQIIEFFLLINNFDLRCYFPIILFASDIFILYYFNIHINGLFFYNLFWWFLLELVIVMINTCCFWILILVFSQ